MLKSIIKGFSLLELVVVLAVMGTLAAVAVPAFNAVTDNSSSGALQSSADGIAKQANSNAQSDSANAGRGPLDTDFGITDSAGATTYTNLTDQGATIDAGTGIVTVWGQKDQCITVKITDGADAVPGTSDDKVEVSGVGSSSAVVDGQATVCKDAAGTTIS